MTNIGLVDFIALSHHQIQFNEQMASYLQSMESCLEIVLATNNFFDFNKSTLQGYFSVLADFIQKMIRLNEEHLAYWYEKE